MTFMHLVMVGVGGGLGSMGRFALSHQMHLWLGFGGFPWGTFTVNFVGSCLIGALLIWLQEGLQASQEWRLLLVVGFLGGFTTFSSFSWDTYALWSQGKMMLAGLNVVANVLFCLLGTAMGVLLTRQFVLPYV